MSKNMKIAVVTVTFNDDYKFEQWFSFYKKYCNSIDYHIVVDNGSCPDYLKKVKTFFKNSVIIENESNKDLTKAYNNGIEYILNNTDANYIMLLANDIDIDGESITQMASFLEANKADMVSPIMFSSDGLIADFGCTIDSFLMLKPYMAGQDKSEIVEDVNYCDALTGGCNLAKRLFYEDVGLQDEMLFMYSDEVDMGIRAKKKGKILASISTAECYHKHINPNNSEIRRPFSYYLMARNKLYLANKHHLKNKKAKIAYMFIKQSIKNFLIGVFKGKKEYRLRSKYIFAGVVKGLKNDMRPNKYTIV